MTLTQQKTEALLNIFNKESCPEANKFFSWAKNKFETEGLESIHLTRDLSNKAPSSETMFAELNRMIEAPDVEDNELFI